MPLGRRNAERTESLAATAGEQVQAIIAAAEAAAAKIREEAEAEAERMRAAARDAADSARAHAADEAKGELSKLSETLASLRRRAEALEAELSSLSASKPPAEAAGAGTARVPEPAVAAPSPTAAVTAAGSSAKPEAAASKPDADEDLEGARLSALNMALNGSSRDEIDRHLADNFSLSDRAALLDEVFASVEG